jgi:hypothetical protein
MHTAVAPQLHSLVPVYQQPCLCKPDQLLLSMCCEAGLATGLHPP